MLNVTDKTEITEIKFFKLQENQFFLAKRIHISHISCLTVFSERYTSNLTFPFEKFQIPFNTKTRSYVGQFFFHFLELEALSGKTKNNINLTSYHLFNATPNIIKIGHFSRKEFVARKKNTKLLANFVTDVTVQISIEMPTSRYIRIHILPLEKV